MAFSLSNISGLVTGWLLNPLIWAIIIFVMVAITWGFLIIRKKKKLIYQCIEIVDHGYDKCSHNVIKCGWYGRKKFLKLWDYGDEQMETPDGEVIYGFSTNDFQEINGKRGVICFRDPVNQNVLVPVNRTKVKNQELLAEIAPQEFRDVARQLIQDATEETRDWKERLMQWIIIGGIIIFALVSIIVIAQMVKNGQKEASQLIVQSGETCLKNAKEICSQIANAGASP